MKELDPYKIAKLITAKKAGDITDEENTILHEWLVKSNKNQELFEKLQNEYSPEFIEEIEKAYNTQSFYDACCKNLDRRKRIILLKYTSFAAAVFLPFLVGLFIWLNSDNLDFDVNQIEPGKFIATLVLPNGEIIDLDDDIEDDRLSINNISFRKDTLIYQNTQNTEVEFHTIKIPRGGEYYLELSDGSKIWLNAETELTVPNVFTGIERRIKLKGEAYFDVAKDAEIPFIVEAGEQTLTVLGTSFAIRAYEDETNILTTLESGKVNIQANGTDINLLPGQQSSVTTFGIEIKDVETDIFTAWHRGIYIFDDRKLGDILNTISRWYKTDFIYDFKELEEISFTGELQKYDNIDEFLTKIEKLQKVKFTKNGRRIIVSRY